MQTSLFHAPRDPRPAKNILDKRRPVWVPDPLAHDAEPYEACETGPTRFCCASPQKKRERTPAETRALYKHIAWALQKTPYSPKISNRIRKEVVADLLPAKRTRRAAKPKRK